MKSLQKFLQILTPPERKRLFYIVLLMTFGVALEAFTLLLVPTASSLILGGAREDLPPYLPAWLSAMGPVGFVTTLLIGGILFIVAKNFFIAFQIQMQHRFIATARESISSRLFQKYLNAPYAFHLTRNSSELIRNVVNEVNEFKLILLRPWMQLFSEILVSAGLVVVLLFLSPVNTIAVGALLGVAGVIYLSLTKGKVSEWGRIRLESDEYRIRCVQQALGAIKEVKLLGLEECSLDGYDRHNALSARASSIQGFYGQIPRLFLEVVALSAVMLIVLISILKGQPIESVIAGLGLLAVAAFRLLPSANRIISASSSLRFGGASIQNLYTELVSEIECERTGSRMRGVKEAGPLPELAFEREIELSEVSFSYGKDDRRVLDSLSLTIPRNSLVGLIGESGSGKSTLVDVILGLLLPTAGKVMVDGVSIYENLRSWQDRLAYVPQQIFLVDTTIRENVAFGVPPEQIDEDRLHEVLKLAHIDRLVDSLPDGVLTEVGERGIRLSGGQCQRIGIARALYRDPEVIVFDEATSALDDESQEKVMEAIRGLKGSRTIIMVSHRVSTIDYCDLVFEIREGTASKVPRGVNTLERSGPGQRSAE